MSVYIPAHVIEECRDALRRGVPIEQLASRLRVAPDVLRALVMLHSPIRVRAVSVDAEVDLWGSERLQGVRL